MSAPTSLLDFVADPQWVAWRTETRNGKPTKVPYCAAQRQAEADNPQTWLTRDQAALLAESIVNGAGGGVGIELGQCGYRWIIGVDLDSCRDPETGAVDPWAVEVIERLYSYTETSPSGCGFKVFALADPADVPALRIIMGTEHGRQFKRTNGSDHPPAIEIYISNRFFTVTREGIEDVPAELRTIPLDDLRWLIEQAGPAFAGKPDGKGNGNGKASTDGSRSAAAFRKGAALRREGKSFEEMSEALRTDPETAEWCREKGDATNGRELRRIWDKAGTTGEPAQWAEPVDFLSDRDRGAPQLQEHHVPPSLWPFIVDTAERLGVATSSVGLATIVSFASVISEEWQIQPKRRDYTWTEAARLWGGIVGPPSILKSPVIAIATAPIVTMEVAARKDWSEQMAVHRAALAAWKAGDKKDPEPSPPRCKRFLVESATIEALQEVLRDDEDGKLFAPQGKVLVRQDELSEFLAGMDKYSTSKGSDRGAYLRAYNGGRFTIDRIGRGSFAANNWSVCLLGGIQPDPIQRIATQAVDDGLLQRMMLDVPPPQGAGKDRTPDHNALDTYRGIFPALAALRPARTGTGHCATVALHADAHAAREDVDTLARVMAAMPDTSPRLQSTFGKWSGLFARLCLTFHLVELAAAKARGEIGPPADVVPLAIATRVRSYMRQILAPNLLRAEAIIFATKQTDHAAWIAGYILANRLDRISAREIVQDYRQLRAPEQRDTLNSTMDSLCTLGWLAPVPSRNEAKPAVAWFVNPAVHVNFTDQGNAERERRAAVRDAIGRHVASLREDVGNVA